MGRHPRTGGKGRRAASGQQSRRARAPDVISTALPTSGRNRFHWTMSSPRVERQDVLLLVLALCHVQALPVQPHCAVHSREHSDSLVCRV